MKKSFVWATLALASGWCAAQEMGRVLSSTPVIQQIAVPRQICANETVVEPGQKSGGGAALGAIAGGAVGNAIGQGSGRAVATMLGIFGGAVLGDRVEGGADPRYQNVQRCTTQTAYENRVAYYSVVYEYAGKQYTVQMPNDPGPQLRLQITPADAAPVSAPPAPTTYVVPMETQTIYTQPVYTQPVYVQPIYPGYYGRPYYPPVGVNLQFGYSSGHHRGHWR